ncbi:Acyl-CoA synthetase family member 2, mitochondrial, partial [Orchesella cincta]
NNESSVFSPEAPTTRISYFSNSGTSPLLGLTIGELLDYSCRKFANNEFLVVPFQGIRKTYRQLKEEVDNLARGFLSLGLKRGDRLAIWSPNTYECYVTQLAAWKAGLILVCINAAYQSRELLYALNKVGVRCIVISSPFRTQNFYEILAKCVPELETSTPGQLKSQEAPELEIVITVDEGMRGTHSFSHVMDLGANSIPLNELSLLDVQFDDVCALFFTSGTTGSPKASQTTHFALVNNGFFVGKRLQIREKDRVCLPVPLFHVYGCQIGYFACLYYGATIVLPSYGYDPHSIAYVSSVERCSIVVGTPTMFTDILKVTEKENYDLSSLRVASTGGAICSKQLVEDLKTKLPFKLVASNYGMTEIGAAYQSLPTDADDLTSTTVGFPGEHVEVKLVDKLGNIVPLGQEGELCVRSYSVTQGYWSEVEKTSEVLKPSRWFHTGDLFVMTESGHARIVGRVKEMINRGGENVYPVEVEEFLKTHPKIQDAQVFGVPDSRMGEEVSAWIIMKEHQIMTVDDVKHFCRGQISHFKIPKYILFRDDFPKTPLGKVQKFRMREETVKVLKL